MPFKSRRQRETFFGKLRMMGKSYPIYQTKNYYSVRIRPRLRGVHRLHDIGKPKRHQLLRVRINKKWRTKSVRIQRTLRPTSKVSKDIVRKAILYQ